MIKSVLQSIPTYVMSCFRLPEYLIHELEYIISKFWWGDGSGIRTIGLSWMVFVRANVMGAWVSEIEVF